MAGHGLGLGLGHDVVVDCDELGQHLAGFARVLIQVELVLLFGFAEQ